MHWQRLQHDRGGGGEGGGGGGSWAKTDAK